MTITEQSCCKHGGLRCAHVSNTANLNRLQGKKEGKNVTTFAVSYDTCICSDLRKLRVSTNYSILKMIFHYPSNRDI